MARGNRMDGGTAAALAATRFLQPLLFNVTAIDACAFAAG
jgi:hypothetical protein